MDDGTREEDESNVARKPPTESTALLTNHADRVRLYDKPAPGDGVLPPGQKKPVRSASMPYCRSISIGRSLSVVRPSDLDEKELTADEKKKMLMSTFAILFAVCLERCTYFSIVGNMVLFCTNELGFTSTIAVTINLIFTGVAYMVPLLGGRIADTIAGRFNTIYGCFLIYVVGAALLPAIAYNYSENLGYDSYGHRYDLPMDSKRGFFVAGIIFVAIGAGGIKANISPFGAQQVEPLGQEAVHSFFNWFYWFVNLGGFIAYLAIVYVQQELGFFLGYLIPAIILFVGLVIFLLPRNIYSIHPHGSVFGFLLALLWEGTCNQGCCYPCCRRKPPSTPNLTGLERSPEAPSSSPDAFSSPVAQKAVEWLDPAKVSCGGSFADVEVDNTKSLIRTLPIFMTLILFSTFTSQNSTTMLLQGERMNPQVGDFVIPAAMLNIFKMVIIVILLPVLDRFVYPLMHRFDRRPTLLQRMGFGMIAGVASLVCMGILEVVRKDELEATGGLVIYVGKSQFIASDISILWQIPQFLLTGVAETFTMVTALEFAYTESPIATQGMMMGTNHLTTGLGNLLGSAIYNIVATVTANDGEPWLPNEINDGYLERFAFLLAGILGANFIAFIFLALWYEYSHLGVVNNDDHNEPSQNITPPILRRPRSKSYVNQVYIDE